MIWTRLVRAELLKLTTTNMPWALLAVLVVISAINAIAVVWGTDFCLLYTSPSPRDRS